MGAKAALCAGDRFYRAAVGVSVAWRAGKGGGGGPSEVPHGPPPFELPPLWLPLTPPQSDNDICLEENSCNGADLGLS